MYDGSVAFVRTSTGDTSSFVAATELHQGSALSPFLFILVVDTETHQLLEGPPFSLLYAGDIALLADTRSQLRRIVQMWQVSLTKTDLKLNVKKTEFMRTGGDVEPITDVNGDAIRQMNKFRYLGGNLSEDGSVDVAVQERITSAWNKWSESTGILCDKRFSNALRSKVCRTVVRPALIHGSECWPLTKALEGKLTVAEMRMLRWCCGLTRLDKVSSEEVRRRMQTAPIQEKVRSQRLWWYGHVLRRNREHPARQVLSVEIAGKRPRRSSKKRWRDVIKRNLEDLPVMEEDAQDRAFWRSRTHTPDPAKVWDKR
ncbi:hypothetical protein Y032_0183g913 [Ancylostoma ceylanicum]|uniref:Reverse transcriptase domain-containing protein n=1 Tax=Ancylostoma ceylanicum TaxID=53326 RepID=A0A016SSG9_9BILA|nr:hypothetical protein Y032_0183g913 [Ancylostoma ceylanicum]